MKKLIFLLIFMMVSGISTAENFWGASNEEKGFSWNDYKNASTEWGKWLYTIKPYWDKMAEASKVSASLITTEVLLNSTRTEREKKFYESDVSYYKEIQNIIPPPELKKYHLKKLELQGEKLESDVGRYNKEQFIKLQDEVSQELERVLKEHKVPQEIIDNFTKLRWD